jgi:single-stranded-DNA-specific exonuclease
MLKMQLMDQMGDRIEALYFGDADTFLEAVSNKYGNIQTQNLFRGKGNGVKMSFTYYPGINEYLGNKTPQIIITHFQ